MHVAVELLGGLGIFLFGLQMMSSGMQKAAGDRLRRILEALTSRPWLAVITGAVVTVLVQSSSTTTVMVVGFSNAGIMGLSQAAGTIMGSNVGTTVTAQVISFDIGTIIYPAIGIGALVNFFGRRRLYKYLGQALLGFGLLILGMTTMSDAMRPLKELEAFQELLITFSDIPILGVLGGAIFTALLQSSSAATGVIIALSDVVTIEAALPLIIGTNLGTCFTVVLAGLGSNLAARRAAAAHVVFNLLGIVVVLLLLDPFTSLVLSTHSEVARQAANAHTIFNVFNTLLVLPFFPYFTALIKKLVPGEEMKIVEQGSRHLDRLMLKTPAAAIGAARKEIIRMSNITREMVQEATQAFLHNDSKIIPHVNQLEELVDDLEKEITIYLSELSQHSLARHQSEAVSRLALATNDIERIGDHAQNIVQLTEAKIEDKLPFSEEALEELNKLYQKIDLMLEKAIYSFESEDAKLAEEVIKDDDEVDDMEKELRQHHIDRINTKKCYPYSGVVYLDILSNFERIGDHATNLAEVVSVSIGDS